MKRRAARVAGLLTAGLLLALRVPAPADTEAEAVRRRLPAPAEAPDEGGAVDFSFDQVDVATFVKLVGEITGRRFVLGDGVSGKITVVSPRVRRQDVYPLFVQILDSVGCSVVEDGPLFRVIATGRRSSPLEPVVGSDEETPADGLITKILRLEHVPAAGLVTALEEKVPGGRKGGISAIEETNHLLITDTAPVVRRIEKIVEEVDRPGLSRVTEVVALQHASADELAEQLNAAIQEETTRAQRVAGRLPGGGVAAAGRQGPLVVAAPQANRLVLVGSASQIADLKRLIGEMDVDAPSGRGRMNAIFLKYLSAKEAADTINALLAAPAAQEGGTADRRRIAIQASEANNALLVDASPGDFDVVQRLVDQLDRLPTQVHISVMIAELSVSEGLTFSIDLAAVDRPDAKGTTVVQGSSSFAAGADSVMNAIQTGLFPSGITVGLAYGNRIDAAGNVAVSYPGLFNLDAVRSDGRFKVLSETSLEAQDNREASVSIVNEIPILKSTVEGGSGTARDVIQNIERIEVGIKLNLTPHMIPGGDVRMELNPSIEAVLESGGDSLTPTIARREVNTTVTVPDGRTIVIAGLTREDTREVRRRVPILGSIPLVGMLFRKVDEVKERTNLLIFVTPRVVENMEIAEGLRTEWEAKTGLPEGQEE